MNASVIQWIRWIFKYNLSKDYGIRKLLYGMNTTINSKNNWPSIGIRGDEKYNIMLKNICT